MKNILVYILGLVLVVAIFYSIIILKPGGEISSEWVIGTIVLPFLCFMALLTCALIIVAEKKESRCILDKQFKIVAQHVLRAKDDYCLYFIDDNKKMTIMVYRDSNFPSEYIGKIIEEIELQVFSFFAEKDYLRVKIKPGQYKYYRVIGKKEGYVKPERLPASAYSGTW